MAIQSDLPRRRFLRAGWLSRRIADTDLQSLVSRLPVLRGLARRDGEEIFDILQGFVASQVLFALIELNILRGLLGGPDSARRLALRAEVPEDRMVQLLRAGAALGLLRRRGGGLFGLSRKGAALLGVPGLEAMIRHNAAFYADMGDPVALMRGAGDTELQRFWPYVHGATGDVPDEVAERYSDLMARSQVLVAQDTLRMVDLSDVTRLMDVGGGSGVFLSHVLRRHPKIRGAVFDLPEVLGSARRFLEGEGLADRSDLCPGSFRSDDLPGGADAISLVRVLYDHDDNTVAGLIRKVFAALPPGGRLIVSEPMSGGRVPDRAGDVYFAFYTMAMGTGKVRSPGEIAALCRAAGFTDIRAPRAPRPFVTSAVTCRKPS